MIYPHCVSPYDLLVIYFQCISLMIYFSLPLASDQIETSAAMSTQATVEQLEVRPEHWMIVMNTIPASFLGVCQK